MAAVLRIGAVAVSLAVLQSPVYASFHFARIVEISRGTAQYPTAQYIVIMPYSDYQNVFNGVEVAIYNATGTRLANFATFAANLPSILTYQRSILVATPDATTILGITPNQVATGTLPTSGLVCFRKTTGGAYPTTTIADCVSYGGYIGSAFAGGSPAGSPAPALPSGSALRRDLGADETLQAADDTNNSAADFYLTGPAAENFAGTKISTVTVTQSVGDVIASWTSTAAFYTIHKTDDPTTVRASVAVAATGGTIWTDPNPNEFSGLTYYVVKP